MGLFPSLQLPLEPRGTFKARITTFDGALVASGYDRIVADGESIWIEVPKTELKLTKFQPRQCTPSRNYCTLSGVTAHEQLQTELSRSPSRHKLAVKVKTNLPSCRLTPGKWYVHAHQVKIETVRGGILWSRRLKTKRLISILRSVFGRAYYPRPNTSRPKTQQRRSRAEPKKAFTPQYTKATTTFTHTATLPNNFTLPIQAPTPPWANPAYYIGQIP